MAQALIPIALTVAGSALSAGGTIVGSNAEAREMRSEAGQLEANAGLERAMGQRRAIEDRRQGRLAQSRALAVAASSGAGASDPTVVNAIADLAGEGEHRALTSLYEGDMAGDDLMRQAGARRREAKNTKRAGLFKAGSTILGAGASLYDRFGA